MATQASLTHSNLSASQVAQVPLDVARSASPAEFAKFGFGFRGGMDGAAREMAQVYGADSVQFPVTTPSIPGLVQFLQEWLPGQVHVMTAAREIDNFVGIKTAGYWEDEQVVQEVLEQTGYAVPYGDYTNVPFSNWNLTFAYRTVVRFELGMRVNNLEEARAGRVRVNSGQAKREAAGLALEIVRNLVGFNGYNSGNDNTYGFLSDPNLPAYVTASNGASSSALWANKTFLEIVKDIRQMIVNVRQNTKGVVDPEKVPTTLCLPTNAVDYLSVTSDFGISVMDWIKKTYSKIRVVNAIQLNTANGGAGVAILFADKVPDLSTDGGETFIQVVPAKFLVLGVAKLAKGYEEDYSNATAGVMCKRPYAVYRLSGIS